MTGAFNQASKTTEHHFDVGDLVRVSMAKFSVNNLYSKAKERAVLGGHTSAYTTRPRYFAF